MGGLAYHSSDGDGGTTIAILTEDRIEELLGSRLGSQSEAPLAFEKLPSHAFIQDKSKSDGLAKSLALLQCAWLVSQVIARAIDSLPITPLELGATALIGCASVAYGFWWFKPQDVRTPIEIGPFETLQPTSDLTGHWKDHLKPFEGPIAPMTFVLGACFVGGINFAAFHFLFPTPIEQRLWIIASALIFTLPFMVLSILSMAGNIEIVQWAVLYIVPGLYVVLRLFLIMEMFVSLRGVPREVYRELSWSDCIPHL